MSSSAHWVSIAGLAVGVGCVMAGAWFGVGRAIVSRRRLVNRAHQRSELALRTATDASLETEAFEPAAIFSAVDEILDLATAICAGSGDIEKRRSDASLIRRWARSVADDLGDGVRLIKSQVDVLRVVNRPGELEDRVVVRVGLQLKLRKDQPRPFGVPRSMSTDVRLTLGRAGRDWRLLTLDGAALSEQALGAALIPGAWADEDRLWEDALAELADADSPHGHASLRDVVSADLPVVEQLREISEVDRRFDGDLLSARLRRIVETWEEACAGQEDLLGQVASEQAGQMLIHGLRRDEPLRIILHDAQVDRWTPTAVELSAAPQVRIAITVSAVRYAVWHRTGRYAEGDTQQRHQISMNWTLTLHRDPAARWQLTSTSSPFTPAPKLEQITHATEDATPSGQAQRGPARDSREHPEEQHGWGLFDQFSAQRQTVYSQPPPADGPWTGRADQAPLQLWLRRRREHKHHDER